jgi:hypothetical protein
LKNSDKAIKRLTELVLKFNRDSAHGEYGTRILFNEFVEAVTLATELSAAPATEKPPEGWVEWIEPFGPNDEPVYLRVSESTAIAMARHVSVGAKGVDVYKSDADALEDFITVRWAYHSPAPIGLSEEEKSEEVSASKDALIIKIRSLEAKLAACRNRGKLLKPANV